MRDMQVDEKREEKKRDEITRLLWSSLDTQDGGDTIEDTEENRGEKSLLPLMLAEDIATRAGVKTSTREKREDHPLVRLYMEKNGSGRHIKDDDKEAMDLLKRTDNTRDNRNKMRETIEKMVRGREEKN